MTDDDFYLNDIMVSIVCITYNHEKYIKDAIESFINQQTNFQYEIIIHDDCSNDNTISIIKEYEKKYPNLIYPIFEKENQYSLGVDVVDICLKKCRGKYVALCEGDDFWCDDYKLQKQFDFMENNLDCSLVTNGYKKLDDCSGKYILNKSKHLKSRYYSVDEIILGDGGLFSTNSMFFRTKYIKHLPQFYYDAPVGDFPLTIFLSLKGNVYFISDVMSVYRINTNGSWTNNMNSGNIIKKQNEFYDKIVEMFNQINLETKNKYNDSICQFLLIKELDILVNTKQFNKIDYKKYKFLYSHGSLKNKLKYFVKIRFPYLFYKLKYGRK